MRCGSDVIGQTKLVLKLQTELDMEFLYLVSVYCGASFNSALWISPEV